MEPLLKCLAICFYFSSFPLSNGNVIDAFVSKDIKDFEQCPWVNGPSVNITHTEDYESIAICWRFMTTAYPHCSGVTSNIIVVDQLEFRVYQPISGMSEDGKQAGWLGIKFQETSEGEKQQDKWRSILFEEQLKIYEWQRR